MRWIEAHTIRQVQRCLSANVPIVGGGSWLLSDGSVPEAVCDLREYPWAQGITGNESGWMIGPDVTLSQWLQALDSENVIAEVIRKMGTPIFRRVATVIGAVANPQPVADLYPVMRLLGADIFYIDLHHDSIQHEKLMWPVRANPRALVGLWVPASTPYRFIAFRKYTKGRLTRVLLNLGTGLAQQGDIMTADFVIGGLSQWPYEDRVAGASHSISHQISQRLRNQGNITPFYQALIMEMCDDVLNQWEHRADRRSEL